MGQNGRGRPQQPAREPSGGGALRVRSRVAWLLRVSRLYGANPAFVRGAAFSAAFAGGAHPEPVSESRVSRWETGRTEVPGRAIRRYEELLGLPASTLTSTVDLVTRYLSPGSAPPARRRPAGEPGDRLESFVDQASSSAPMSGPAWEEGVGLVMAEPGLRLRRREWDSICARLLVETIAADGDAWKPRFEAFSRLLQHPGAQSSAAAACADWAQCRDNQVYIETVSLLDGCRHPDAAVAIVGQLTDPTNDFAFAGALLACIRKVPEGDFSPGQLATVGETVAAVLADNAPRVADLRSHAAAVLAGLPPSRAAAAAARRAAPYAGRPGPAGPVVTGDSLSSLIAARSVSLLPREIARFADHVLPALIDEILQAPVADTRLYSAFLIRATPYAQPVASALGWSLGRLRLEHSPLLAARLLEALRILGGGSQRGLAERLTDPSLPFGVQEAAFRALGHMGGTSAPSFWPRAFARHSPRARAGSGGSQRLLGHAVYAIAMERDLPRLRRIAADPALPGPVRAAARWWLGLPSHMLASAEH